MQTTTNVRYRLGQRPRNKDNVKTVQISTLRLHHLIDLVRIYCLCYVIDLTYHHFSGVYAAFYIVFWYTCAIYQNSKIFPTKVLRK